MWVGGTRLCSDISGRNLWLQASSRVQGAWEGRRGRWPVLKGWHQKEGENKIK